MVVVVVQVVGLQEKEQVEDRYDDSLLGLHALCSVTKCESLKQCRSL